MVNRKKRHIRIILGSALILLSASSFGVPQPMQKPTEVGGTCGIDMRQYNSPLEAAQDPQLLQLFQPWLGVSERYVNAQGKWRKDASKSSAHSLAGLRRKNYATCHLNVNGISGFARYGQMRNTGTHGKTAVADRGGAWPANVSPEQQGRFHCYCKIFNVLAPYWIELGYLQH